MRKTSTLHTINATEEKLKKNLYDSYLDILKDCLKEDTAEYFENEAHMLSEAIQTVDKHGFASLFKDGYTMMLLDPQDFNFIDRWFNKPGSGNENLQVVVTKSNGSVEIISDEDLSY